MMVVYIPYLAGYFEDALDILKKSYKSMKRRDIDVLVYDNGSCAKVKEYLREQDIDYLITAKQNNGAINALFQAVSLAPGEIIAYTDYDVLFDSGWLEPQLEIIDAYNAGMVSGTPAGFSAEDCNKSAPKGVLKPRDLKLHQEWADSIGSHSLQRAADSPQVHLTRDGVDAIVGAKHFQFLAYKETLLEIKPAWCNEAMSGHPVLIDKAIDDAGYLRLSTVDRYVRHIGNKL